MENPEGEYYLQALNLTGCPVIQNLEKKEFD